MKKTQKLRIIRYFGDTAVTFFCKYKDIDSSLDIKTSGAVQNAITELLKEPCKGISMNSNGIAIQVDLLD
jgi:hypothetical protein